MIKLYNNVNMNLIYQPETYKTLLNGETNECSKYTIIRRKISKLLKYGIICSKKIKYSSSNPGREVIFYKMEKEYFIVFTKNNVYYCENIITSDNEIKLFSSYILNNNKWIKKNDINLELNEVVLCF